MITIIAPHARPEFASNLLANFRRQRKVNARLVVVENGPASSRWPCDVVVLRSGYHQADAMNVGLKWLRTEGDGSWARFDDDDYYGPAYLSETTSALRKHHIVGKTWGFVLFDDGMFRFTGVENQRADLLTGGTLASATAFVPPFKRYPDDDVRWCQDARLRGFKLWATSHRNYCYDRRSRTSQRVIDTPPLATRWGFGPAEFHGRVTPKFVDHPRAPIGACGVPTDDELVAEASSV